MSKLRRVAHVMRRFTLSKWGGTESVVLNVCQQMEKRGIPNTILCTDMFSQPGEETVGGISVKRHRYVFPWFSLSEEARHKLELKGGSPLSLSLFFSLLWEKDLSLIHVHVQHRLGGIARTVARWRGIPYAVSIHGGHFTMPEDHAVKMQEPFKGKWEWGKLFGWLFGARRTLDDADAIICVGRDEFEAMSGRYPGKRVYYLPNGVDAEKFESADPMLFRKKHGLADDESFILCVSRIDFQKNQVLLVQAFAEFAKRHPKYKLVLIGPVNVESYYDDIIATARSLDVEERLLVIQGYAPDDPLLMSAYRGADMFVLPSHTEPFGIVILEAWAAGVPVIASRVGGIPGFTHPEEDIVLFADGDLSGLVYSMERLATDKRLRQRLIAGGSATVQHYSWPQIVDNLVEIYAEIISGKDYLPQSQ